MNTTQLLLIGSILLFVSIIASKTGKRLGIPVLILFLVVGVLAGAEGIGGIRFSNPLMAQFIGIVALNFILFSGGIETKWKEVKPILSRGILLSTVGVLITAGAVGLFIHFISDFSVLEGMLLGAIVSSTDAAAVFSILKSGGLSLKNNLKPTLELESGSNDPMAYFLTTSLIFLIQNPATSAWELAWKFLFQMGIGCLCGWLLGRAFRWCFNRVNLNFRGLYPVFMLSMMFFAYAFTHTIGGNGFLAVYISAIILGNSDLSHKESVREFYDGSAWLMQIILFITLGLLVKPAHILPVMGLGICLVLFLIFVARPIAVHICLSAFKMQTSEKHFLSWVGLRGAVPIVFATFPLIAGLEQSSTIFNLVFFVSVSSVLIQGTTLKMVAKWLKLDLPDDEKRSMSIKFELSPEDHHIFKKLKVKDTLHQQYIKDVQLPNGVLIMMIKRNGRYITPGGQTKILSGDELMVLATDQHAMDQVTSIDLFLN